MKSPLLKLLCALAMIALAMPAMAAESAAPKAQATPAATPAAKAAEIKPAAAAPAPAAAAKPAVTPAAASKSAIVKAAEPKPAPAVKPAEVKPAATAPKAAAPKAIAVKAAPVAKPVAKATATTTTAAAKPAVRKRAARPALPVVKYDPAVAAKIPAFQPYPRNQGWVTRHYGFVSRAHQGKCDVLFLGDSITDGWNGQKDLWAKYFEPLKTVNFGISGDRTENIIWRITNGELDGIQPKVIMMLIGTNNTSKGDSAEDIARGITVIVRTLQARLPKARILLLGVYPRGASPADAKTAAFRANITAVNKIISNLDDGVSVRYLYFGDKFLAADGTLPKSLMPDALHLSKDGYQIWADSVNPVIAAMLK